MNELKVFFNFTRKERNGIFILLLLIFILEIIILYSNKWLSKDPYNFNEFEKNIDQFLQSEINKANKDTFKQLIHKDTCFVNINHPNPKNLECLSVPSIIIKRWINYVQKGGYFKNTDDLLKIWGMNDSILNSIRPFLLVNDTNHYKTTTKTKIQYLSTYQKEPKIRMIDINTCDTNDLIALPMIGSSFANRIIKYRYRLGGFYNKEQLKEIYGLNDDIYNIISPYLYVDIFEIKKININKANYIEMIQHPYLSKEIVKNILSLRKKGIFFTNIEDLLIHQIISNEEAKKLEWYLEF